MSVFAPERAIEGAAGRAAVGVVARACALLLVALLALAFGGLALARTAHAAESGPAAGASNPGCTGVGAALTTSANGVDTAKAAADEAQRKAKLARRTIGNGVYNIGSVSRPKLSLAVKGGSAKSGAKVVPVARDSSNWAQKWVVTWDDETGYYKIRNLGSRKYLSVSGRVKPGAAVKQVSAAKSGAQLWEPVQVEGGIMFKPAASDLALATAAKGSKASFKLQKAAPGAAAQAFKLRTVDALEAGSTYFIGNVASGKRLHVAGNSTKGGAKLDLASPKSAKSQKFRLVKAGSSYRLQNVGSCYYAGANGGAARQMKAKSGKRTAWNVELNLKEAAFTIASSKSGKFLNGASSKLTLAAASGAGAQLFAFSPTYAFKVFLNPGHGWNSNGNGAWDSGAVGSGHQEAEFSHDLAKRVISRLAGTDVKVVNGEKYKLAFWKRLPKAVSLGCDAIVSIHFDAGGDSGTLKMVGVQGRAPGSKALANAVHKGVVSNLRLRDRGWSYRSDITCVNGSIPSMLTEVCFMDNAGDVRTYLSRRNAVAAGIASGIVKASRTRAVVNGRA